MRGLTVLLDADDLACFEAAGISAETEILAFDLDPHQRLRARGIVHLTPFDLVSPGDRAAFDAFEASVHRFWSAHATIEFEGVDLLGLARSRHTTCFSRLAWAAFVMRRALERLRPCEVIAFDEPSGGHGLDQPPGAGRMPLLSGLFRGLAEDAGIRVRLLRRPCGLEPWSDRVAARTAPQLSAIQPSGVDSGRPLVVFQANGNDLVRQLPVIERLVAGGELEVAQIYKVAEGDTLEQLHAAGHHLWHECQVTAGVEACADPDLTRSARAAWEDAARSAPRPLRCLFSNRHLASHFDFIFGAYARRMTWQVRAWRRFFRSFRPRLLAANHPAPVFDLAADAGVATLALPHGLMVLGHAGWFQPPSTSMIAAINPLHAQRLKRDHDASRIRVTGDPAVDSLGARMSSALADRAAIRAHLRRRLGRDPDVPLVAVLTTSVSAPALAATAPNADWKRACADLEALFALAARRPEWALVLKCHPRYDHFDTYRRMNQSAGAAVSILSEEPLESLAVAADAIVVPNAISSALVEVSLAATPVIVLDSAMVWWGHERWGTDPWPRANTVGALEDWLARVLGDARAADGAAQTTRRAAHRFVGGDDDRAAACAEWIAETASTAVPDPTLNG